MYYRKREYSTPQELYRLKYLEAVGKDPPPLLLTLEGVNWGDLYWGYKRALAKAKMRRAYCGAWNAGGKKEDIAITLGYLADVDGVVISPKGKIVTQHETAYGYLRFSAGSVGVDSHRFVWRFFNEEIPHGLVIHHIDWNRKNNAWDNLALATPGQNVTWKKPKGLCV